MKNVMVRGNLGSADTSRNWSPNIWYDCPWDEIKRGNQPGIAFYYDFSAMKESTNINAAEAYWNDGLMVFGSNGAAIAHADEVGAGVTVSSDGDDEGFGVRQVGAPFQVSRSHQKFWFEMRMKTSTIADTKHGFFLGMTTETAITATSPIAADGTLADLNFFGFHRLEGDGDELDCVYKANGVTQVTVEEDALTLTADTYFKAGMKFSPTDDILRWYGNNLQLDTYTVASAAGTDFPNDVRVGFAFALLNATATTPGNCTLDWVRVAQLF